MNHTRNKPPRTQAALRHTLVLLAALAGSGCAAWQPWVQPHERGFLADPIMEFDRHPLAGQFIGHVYEIREGARGADGGAGGGCGCN